MEAPPRPGGCAGEARRRGRAGVGVAAAQRENRGPSRRRSLDGAPDPDYPRCGGESPCGCKICRVSNRAGAAKSQLRPGPESSLPEIWEKPQSRRPWM